MLYNYLRAVDEIERRYPPERVASSQARLAATWNLQRPLDAIPFVFTGFPDTSGVDGNALYEARYPRDEMLAYQLERILARSALDDDYIPSLFPGCRQGLLPTAYGAAEVWQEGHFWVAPLLDSAEQAYELKHPDLTCAGVAAGLLENTRFFRRATEGRLPIQMPDMQGPLDLASNMLGTERLSLEMYDHPEAVHHLLTFLTEDFIRYLHLQEDAAEGTMVPIHCMPVVWLPPGRAMSLSEDMLAVISRRLYPQFARPYNERIAAEFGGVVIHSCGSWEHNLVGLAQTKGLLGVNFGVSETRLEWVADQFGASVVLLPHHTEVTCNGLPRFSTQEYVDFIFDFVKARDLRVIALPVPLGAITAEECIEIGHLARQRAKLSMKS